MYCWVAVPESGSAITPPDVTGGWLGELCGRPIAGHHFLHDVSAAFDLCVSIDHKSQAGGTVVLPNLLDVLVSISIETLIVCGTFDAQITAIAIF